MSDAKSKFFFIIPQFRLQNYYFFLTYANILRKKIFFFSQYCTYGFFFVILHSDYFSTLQAFRLTR